MADFTEIWELRNKLILDGLYPMDEGGESGIELERKITALAREYYNWEAPSPRKIANGYNGNIPVGAEELSNMTPKERIEDALDILLDWDGYRSVRGLGDLIDEVRERLAWPVFLEKKD